MLTLEIAPEAASDLREIAIFSNERFGPEVAARYLADIRAAIERVRQQPQSGRKHGRYRVVSVGRHRVYYAVLDDALRVLRILHQAMLLTGRLPD